MGKPTVKWDNGGWTLIPATGLLTCAVCGEPVETDEKHWQRASTDGDWAIWHTACGGADLRFDTVLEPIAPDGPPCPRCSEPMFKVYVDDDEDFVWGHDCEPD